ncbi:MAG: CBS domain-containing protein [Candidatus Nanohaloarchaeota archaeon]|nr:CBS domain-containing protein [Candidatus Nanohaloarchaeota archaeon]
MEEYVAKDVMNPHYVKAKEVHTLRYVSQKIIDANASEAIVFNEKNKPKGIITLRDITRAVAKGHSPRESIRHLMTKHLITVEENTPLKEVLRVMAKNNISRVPVINNKGDVIGIIGEKHLLKIIPGVMDILEELAEMNTVEPVPEEEERLYEGYCDVCENYSEELRLVNGKFICPECLEEHMEG